MSSTYNFGDGPLIRPKLQLKMYIEKKSVRVLFDLKFCELGVHRYGCFRDWWEGNSMLLCIAAKQGKHLSVNIGTLEHNKKMKNANSYLTSIEKVGWWGGGFAARNQAQSEKVGEG